MGVPVGLDVALRPIFEPLRADEPLRFEVGEAELTGEAVGLALGRSETFWSALEGVIDVVGEGAEVAGVNGRSGCDRLSSLLAAFFPRRRFDRLLLVVLNWIVFDGLDFVGRATVSASSG